MGMYHLGIAYKFGRGVEIDLKKAEEWISFAKVSWFLPFYCAWENKTKNSEFLSFFQSSQSQPEFDKNVQFFNEF